MAASRPTLVLNKSVHFYRGASHQKAQTSADQFSQEHHRQLTELFLVDHRQLFQSGTDTEGFSQCLSEPHVGHIPDFCASQPTAASHIFSATVQSGGTGEALRRWFASNAMARALITQRGDSGSLNEHHFGQLSKSS